MTRFDLPLEELRTYAPAVAEPENFDAFWTDTVAASRAAAGEVEAVPVEAPMPHVDVSDVTFPGFDGQPVKAWYSRPSGTSEDLPVVVQFQGYGGGRGLPFEHTFWPSAGFAHLMMDTRGQGSVWGSGGDTPDPGGSAPAVPGFLTRGVLDPVEYYYRRVFTDAVRAVDAARKLPGTDHTRIFVAGGSQGGGIAIAAAALVGDIAGALVDVPFLCHYARAVEITDEYPYQELTQYLAVHRDYEEQVFRTLSYFDGVNFASRAKVPVLFSVGLMDRICPPSTGFAAFHAWGHEDKDMAVYPFNGHEGGGAHQARRQWTFLRERL